MKRLLVPAVILTLGAVGRADFKVLAAEDVVTLIDGSEIRGTVIAVGMKAVIIAAEDTEIVIPRSQVESIVRGPTRAETLKFMTDPVDGLKVITGKGFREEEVAAEGELEAASEEKKGEKARPKRKRGPKATKRAITPDAIRQLMKRDKRLEQWVKIIGGPEKAAEFAKRMGDDALKKLLGDLVGGKK